VTNIFWTGFTQAIRVSIYWTTQYQMERPSDRVETSLNHNEPGNNNNNNNNNDNKNSNNKNYRLAKFSLC
jgi:hypothetical protein